MLPSRHPSPIAVLFVEDNEDIRFTTRALWDETGLDVVACASAEEALAETDTRSFDMIITDISLPGLSGVELARLALERAPDTWVVFCSGYVFDCDLKSVGANVRSLQKPIEPEVFDALLAELRHSVAQRAMQAG